MYILSMYVYVLQEMDFNDSARQMAGRMSDFVPVPPIGATDSVITTTIPRPNCDAFSVYFRFLDLFFDIPVWFDLSSGCGRPVFLGWLDSFRLRAAEVDGYGCEKYAILSPQRPLRLSRACLGK